MAQFSLWCIIQVSREPGEPKLVLKDNIYTSSAEIFTVAARLKVSARTLSDMGVQAQLRLRWSHFYVFYFVSCFYFSCWGERSSAVLL